MKIDELRALMSEDEVIDKTRLDDESLKIPVLHGKWYGLYLIEFRMLKGLELEIKKLARDKFEYYTGKCNDDIYKDRPLPLKVNKHDAQIYTEADEDIQRLKSRHINQQIKVDMILDFLKNVINTRGFQIRDAIEFIKWKSGK